MKYEIRAATESDRSWAINVTAKNILKTEIGRPDLFNLQQLHLVITKMIQEGTALIVLADGKRVGCVGGILTPHFLNPSKTLIFEVVWYVTPEFRGTRVPYLLMKSYRDLVYEKADEGIFTIVGDSSVKDQSMLKLGWKLQERHYSIRK